MKKTLPQLKKRLAWEIRTLEDLKKRLKGNTRRAAEIPAIDARIDGLKSLDRGRRLLRSLRRNLPFTPIASRLSLQNEIPFMKPAGDPGFDEVDALDASLFKACGRITRALNDPVVPKGHHAIISVTFQRNELEALAMLLQFADVPVADPGEYLPTDGFHSLRN